MLNIAVDRKQVKRRGRRLGLSAFAAIAVALLASWGWTDTGLRLDVVECDSQEVLLQMEVKKGTDFSIWFLHSYDKAPFEEHYRVLDRDRILLTHMTFKSSLNGQGFVLGTYRTMPGGYAELADINQELAQVTFRLGSPDLANHALIVHGRRLRLLDHANAGTLLCIRVRSSE